MQNAKLKSKTYRGEQGADRSRHMDGNMDETEADNYNDQTRSEGNTETKYTDTDDKTRNR